MNRFLFVTIIFIAICLSHEFVSAYSSNPPPNQTGAPNENHCATACHGNTLNQGQATLNFSLEGNTYLLDSVYTLTFELLDPTRPRFGFQMTALDSNENKAGNFTAGNKSGVQLGMSRQYINHMNADTTKLWQFLWKAPSSNVGPVHFYLAANASNGNSSVGGDDIYTREYIVNPDSSLVGLNWFEIGKEFFNVFPNPAHEKVNLSFSRYHSYPSTVAILDIEGRKVIDLLTGNIPGKSSIEFIIPETWSPGIYFIEAEWNNERQSKKLVIY